MSPSPLSLLCALLLTLPLAIVFTITITTTPSTSSTTVIGGATTISTTSTTYPVVITLPTAKKTQQKLKNETTSILPPTIQSLLEDDDDDDDDDSLFQLASLVNPNPSPTKKLAFMFLTTTPLPLAPLWEIYFNGTTKNLYNIYLHADPSSQYDPPFQGVFRNRTIPSKPTRRHSPTLIAAHRRLLSHALLDDPSNYMFALVSSSCIPLHSFNFTYRTLIKSRKSFIEILKNEGGAFGRWVARGNDAMLPEVTLENFRIGSQFSVMTRRHAKIVVSDTRVWSKFRLPCVDEHLNKCYPEENYFPTLLSMMDPRGCVPATLTHVDWKGHHDGHPHTYHTSDVRPELILALRRDRPRYGDDGTNGSDSTVTKHCHHPFLFGRKFGADTIGTLSSIANDIIFKD